MDLNEKCISGNIQYPARDNVSENLKRSNHMIATESKAGSTPNHEQKVQDTGCMTWLQ